MSSPKPRQSRMRRKSAASTVGSHPLHRRGRCLQLTVLLVGLLLPAVPLWSQPSLPAPVPDPLTDADQILGFADALFGDGDYYRAITEYKRFLFLFPTDARAGRVQLQIGLAYLRGQQWEDARQTFESLARRHPDADIRREAAFLLGETAYQQGRYPQAIEALRPLAEREPQSLVGQRARYLLGWSYLRARQWPEAAGAFAAIDAASPLFSSAQALSEAACEAEHLPRKSPALAGLLSAVIPGTGHFYTGRLRDGAIALLLNGAFLAAGIEAVQAGHEAAAGLLFFFEAAWYSGAIYGAVNAAHKFNRDAEDRFLQGLERQHRSDLRPMGRLTSSLVLVHIPF
jgi:TolA-binding protein